MCLYFKVSFNFVKNLINRISDRWHCKLIKLRLRETGETKDTDNEYYGNNIQSMKCKSLNNLYDY